MASAVDLTGYLGMIGLDTVAKKQAWKAAGGSHSVHVVYWDQTQSTLGGAVNLTNITQQLDQCRSVGLTPILELGIQYAPQAIKDALPKFKNQAGTELTSGDPGADLRDWVWTQAGRNAVSDFASKTLTGLAPRLKEVAYFRAGGGNSGELAFAQPGFLGKPTFWSYGAAAQMGVGIAAGQVAAPDPGYLYTTGTDAAKDARFVSWHLNGLRNWMTWWLGQHRALYSGPLYVMHPSFGLRTNMVATSDGYKYAVADGGDWAGQMDAYAQMPAVYPYCTWLDGEEQFWNPAAPIDSDKSAARKLYELARERGFLRHLLGENTGGGGAAAITRTKAMLTLGYQGATFFGWDAVVTDNSLTTVAQLKRK